MNFFTYILFFICICTQSIYAQCSESANVWNDSWTSCQISPNPNIEEPLNIGSLHIWNANRIAESHLGAKDVIIDFSEDGENWIELGNFNFPQANESEVYEGFDGPDFEGISVRKILFTVLNTHNTTNNCASIAEVQFELAEKEIEEEEEEIIIPVIEEEVIVEVPVVEEEVTSPVIEEEVIVGVPVIEEEVVTPAIEEEVIIEAPITEEEAININEELEEEIEFGGVYPNPFETEITITGAANSTARIYDIAGNLLMNRIIAEDNSSLDLTNLSTGLYYIIITLPEKVTAYKIIKQ